MVWSSKNRRHKEEMVRIYRRTIQKDLHDPDNHDGVITHLEPDILECEVKWALESITTNKASGGDGIPAELPGKQAPQSIHVPEIISSMLRE